MCSNLSHSKYLSMNKDQSTQLGVSLSERTSNDYAPILLKIPGPYLKNSSLTLEISKRNPESDMYFYWARLSWLWGLELRWSLELSVCHDLSWVRDSFILVGFQGDERDLKYYSLQSLYPNSPPQFHFNLGFSLIGWDRVYCNIPQGSTVADFVAPNHGGQYWI